MNVFRQIEQAVITGLQQMPVVALLGPRQVGKTTLALEIADRMKHKPSTYLDLELDSDLSKLSDPEGYLKQFDNQLLIIDEVQQKPDLFRIIRGLVDIRRRKGEKAGHFLLLGSASKDLLQQSSESLAGRIRYLELTPFTISELSAQNPLEFSPEKLWFRGGFPDSYLASTDEESFSWRRDFVSTYVERDIPVMGPQVSATRMRRFWTMLAHFHGQQINFSSIAKSLETSHTTIRTYLDILTDFYMVRQIQPWSGNTKKRLVKSPKIFIRDTGILHYLLSISRFDDLFGHPVVGASWEGFVIENIIDNLPEGWRHSYYRTATQTEIDLVLEGPRNQRWAIEVKRSVAPTLSKGFHAGSKDIQATKKFVVYSGKERFPMQEGTEAIGGIEFLELLGR